MPSLEEVKINESEEILTDVPHPSTEEPWIGWEERDDPENPGELGHP